MIAVIAVVLAVCFFGWEEYYRKHWMKDISVDLHFSEPAVYAGSEVTLTETIENRKKLPVHILEIAFRVRKGVVFPDAENITESDYVYKRDVFSLLGMERIIRRYTVRAVKRGHYEIDQTGEVAYSVPGHRKYEEELNIRDDFYVYAKRTDVKGILEPVMTLLGEAESRRKLYEDPFAFAGIRDYTTSDPMKTVNWKASAKTGGLMVNTYSSVCSETVRIFLDVEDRNIRKQQPLIEESVSIAATLCEKLTRGGQEVSLYVNAPYVNYHGGADASAGTDMHTAGAGASGANAAASAGTNSSAAGAGASAGTDMHTAGAGASGTNAGAVGLNMTSTAGCTIFGSARGKRRQTAVEQYLTTDFASVRTSDFISLIRDNPPDERDMPLTVIISKNVTDDLAEAAREVSETGAGCVLVVPKERFSDFIPKSSGSLRVIVREVLG